MTAKFPYPRVGVSTIIVHRGELLLTKRQGSHGAGTWEMAGGGLELGESLEAGARREVDEELGLEGLHGFRRLNTITEDIFDDQHWITHYFVAHVTGSEVIIREPHKITEYRWVSAYFDDMADWPTPQFLCVPAFVEAGGMREVFQHLPGAWGRPR